VITRALPDAAATAALGEALGAEVTPDTVLLLCGEMGAGKTTFVRALARGLGCPGRVTSPTFVLSQRHEGGRLPLVHADAWRLTSADDLRSLELDEAAAGGVLALEWGDRFPEAAPAEHLVVTFGVVDEGRTVIFAAVGATHARWEAWLAARIPDHG
jgi:tRNA threonylcarbamoyladenosine biosynthesis protein TsaE